MSRQDLDGVRVAVLTLSDSIARGEHADTSGDVVVEAVGSLGAEVIARDVLPDDAARISARLRAYADDSHADLVLTTGGSGVAPHASSAWPLGAGDYRQQRRLACAVGADHGDDLAAVRVEADPAQRLQVSEALAEPADAQQGAHSSPRGERSHDSRVRWRLR